MQKQSKKKLVEKKTKLNEENYNNNGNNKTRDRILCGRAATY